MPVTLARTISKIQSIPNSADAQLVKEMYEHLKSSVAFARHQHNVLKVMITFANYVVPYTTFFDINSKEPILALLDTKKKNDEDDTEKKWITTTWNSYLVRLLQQPIIVWMIVAIFRSIFSWTMRVLEVLNCGLRDFHNNFSTPSYHFIFAN